MHFHFEKIAQRIDTFVPVRDDVKENEQTNKDRKKQEKKKQRKNWQRRKETEDKENEQIK